LLPDSKFKAFVWDAKQSDFNEVETDIFENKHFMKTGENFDDSVMYLKVNNLMVDQLVVIKLIKSETI